MSKSTRPAKRGQAPRAPSAQADWSGRSKIIAMTIGIVAGWGLVIALVFLLFF